MILSKHCENKLIHLRLGPELLPFECISCKLTTIPLYCVLQQPKVIKVGYLRDFPTEDRVFDISI